MAVKSMQDHKPIYYLTPVTLPYLPLLEEKNKNKKSKSKTGPNGNIKKQTKNEK